MGFFVYSNTTNGAWSTVGSRMVKSTEISTICEYDHTTNFALLMSPGKTVRVKDISMFYTSKIMFICYRINMKYNSIEIITILWDKHRITFRSVNM